MQGEEKKEEKKVSQRPRSIQRAKNLKDETKSALEELLNAIQLRKPKTVLQSLEGAANLNFVRLNFI